MLVSLQAIWTPCIFMILWLTSFVADHLVAEPLWLVPVAGAWRSLLTVYGGGRENR